MGRNIQLSDSGAMVDEAGTPVASTALSDLNTVAAGWQAPTLGNSWANFGSGTQGARYRKIGDVVEIEGNVAGGASGSSPFTLPAGFRPAATQHVAVIMAAGIGFLTIPATGVVLITEVTVGAATTLTALNARFSTL